MKVFTCTDHEGHWPVPVASAVIATSEGEARQLLDAELLKHNLKITHYTLREIQIDRPQAFVLSEGDY
jgi:hypothetical protein